MSDQATENKGDTQLQEVDLLAEEKPEKPPTPLERFLKKFRGVNGGSKPPSPTTRKDLGKDKSKALFVLIAAAVALVLFLLAIFSSPQKTKQQQMWQHRGQPDLGRRITPGQAQQQAGSVTPLLNAQTQRQSTMSNGEVTPEDIRRTSQMNVEPGPVAPNTAANTLLPPSPVGSSNSKNETAQAPAPTPNNSGMQKYALGRINIPDVALQQEYAKVGYSEDSPTTGPDSEVLSTKLDDDLKKPSLVFVRNETSIPSLGQSLVAARNPIVAATAANVAPPSLDSILPPGTRLVARLESPASTAVAAPVVAAIEYNYEQDGQIVVPAGSKAIGKLEQANPSGYVSLDFTKMELPDGTSEKIDGISMGLNYGPVKGLVNGRRRGARFLVQTLTGLGTMASYLVGAGNFSGPLSESGLLRERIADNAGIAGQNELNQLSFNQNIVVTVPGNTRFYIVLQKTDDVSAPAPEARSGTGVASTVRTTQAVPNLEELRELLELQREMSQLYPQGASAPSQPSGSQNQQ